MESKQERLIADNIVKNIKFTQAEIKILSCFTLYIIKSKAIGIILGSSSKTIDTHIGNIKRKIDTNNKEDIYFFLKSSSEFEQLKIIFEQIYVDYKYKQAVTKIAYKLKALSVVCNLMVSTKLTGNLEIDEISQAIKLAGIKINKMEHLPLLQGNSSNLKSTQFYLFFIQNIGEITYYQQYMANFGQNVKYVCLGQLPENTKLCANNLLFYNKNAKKDFYKFFLKYLITVCDMVAKDYEIIELLSFLDNDKQFQFKELRENNIENQQIFPRKNKLGTINNAWKWLIIIMLILGFVGLSNHSRLLSKEQKPVVELGISQLKSNISEVAFLFNLPSRNSNFTGRLKDFITIKNKFDAASIGIVIQAVVGCGGIGKTQLITEYAYRAIDNKEYDAVLWLPADSINSINNAYMELAERLNINIDDLNVIAVKKIVHKELLEQQQIKKILFVLDNISPGEEILQFLAELRSQWPINSKTHVLISTRNQHVNFHSLILDVFTKDEARMFVKKQLIDESEQDIGNLIKLLHCYPLALEQAVGYIKQHTNIKDYIELYNNKAQRYLNFISANFNEYNTTLWKTLAISLLRLTNNAKDILYTAAYLEPNKIQLEIFTQFTIEQRAKAIKELREHSFITMAQDRQSFKIHVLIQEIIRLMLEKNPVWLNKTIKLAKQGVATFNQTDKNTWNNARNWLYHISSVYQNIPKTLATAELLDGYAKVAKYFGLYELMPELLVNSLQIKKQYFKTTEQIKLVDTFNNLGYVKMRQGDYLEAKKYYQKAFKITKDYYRSSNNIALTESLEGLAWVESCCGRYDKAKKLLQKILKIKGSYYRNTEHLDLLEVLSDIGDMELCLGYYEKSKKIQEKALKIHEKYYQNTNDILVVNVLQRLAIAEWGLGNFDKARNLYKRVLLIKQEHYQQPEHIAIANTLQGLGLLEFSVGNYIEAKDFLEHDLKIRKNHYQTANHLALASSLHTLGLTEESLGNYKAALVNINKAYEISKKYYKNHLQFTMAGDYSPVVRWPIITQINKKQAIDYYKKTLHITKNIFGDNSHMTARYYYLLGQTYELDGQKKQASKQYEQALKIAKQFTLYINDASTLNGHQKNIDSVRKKLNKLNR